jgi:uncharacterized membrane protein YjjB (DUF3815 family)
VTAAAGPTQATPLEPIGRRTEPLVIVATIAVGLAIDQFWRPWGLWFVSAFTVAVFIWLVSARTQPERRRLWVCLVLATAGEVFLSLVWQLYHYRDGGIPPFVPPGHVLLFVLGVWCAARVPARFYLWVGGLALLLAAMLAFSGKDWLSALMVAIFVVCLFNRHGRTLYAVMFVLALAMELYGTWLGNWRWETTVPYWGISTLNPPFAAGVFYCLLDFLVVTLTGRNDRGA